MEGIRTDGLASGINSGEIIDSIIAVERRSVVLLENRKALSEAKLEAIQTFNTRLLSAGLDLTNLRRGSTYSARSGSSSDEAVLTASAGTTAIPGTYELNVLNRAAAHQLATSADGGLGGQATATTSVGAGSFDIQVGNGSLASISIDAGSSSLADIATAINNQDVGVTASVVQDGVTGNFRMIMQAAETGLGNDVTISNVVGAELQTLFGNTSTLTASSDASVQLGTTNPITVNSSSNTVEDLIPGVDLELQSTGATTVTVASDDEPVVDAISTFVESFNSALEYLNANTAFDAAAQEGGILISESDLRRGMNSLISSISQTVDTGSTIRSIFQVGLSLNRDTNLLEFNETELRSALDEDPEGVRKLFSNTGTSSSVGVSFAALSNATNTANPFDVDITTPATRAQMTGTQDLSGNTVLASGSNTLDLEINSTSFTVTLADGTYSGSQLVSLLQDGIDTAMGTPGRVLVGLDGSNQLTFTAASYGSANSIAVQGGNLLTDLGLSLGSVSGQNVAGTINGVAATGSGQVLRGAEGSDAEGLSLLVTATAPINDVTLTASKGIGQLAKQVIDDLTLVDTGTIPNKENALTSTITDLTERIEEGDERLDFRRRRIEQEFLTMETLIAGFQSQQNFLAGQIEAFAASSSAFAQRSSGN